MWPRGSRGRDVGVRGILEFIIFSGGGGSKGTRCYWMDRVVLGEGGCWRGRQYEVKFRHE